MKLVKLNYFTAIRFSDEKIKKKTRSNRKTKRLSSSLAPRPESKTIIYQSFNHVARVLFDRRSFPLDTVDTACSALQSAPTVLLYTHCDIILITYPNLNLHKLLYSVYVWRRTLNRVQRITTVRVGARERACVCTV